MAQIINATHLWLLSQFWNVGSETRKLTLKEIQRARGGYPKRTLHEHIRVLADVLGIEIECDPYNVYSISNMDVLSKNKILQWTIAALNVQLLLKDTKGIKNLLFLEDLPGGTMFLATITEALRKTQKLRMHYKAFKYSTVKEFLIRPYALKTYRRRWYVLAKVDQVDNKDNDGELRHFALDRIVDIKLEEIELKTKEDKKKEEDKKTKKEKKDTKRVGFKKPSIRTIKDYYSGAVGIWVENNQASELVTLRAYGIQAEYLRTLPLHSSQKEVGAGDGYVDFSYYVALTPDLVREVLARGNELEAIKPQKLRDMIKAEITLMGQRY